MSRASTYLNYLTNDLGLPRHVGAGILGNLVQESGLNPNGPSGDNGTAHGLAQWRGDRWTNLNNFARQRNMDVNDWRTQLQFLNYELKTSYSSTYQKMLNSQTPTEVAKHFVLGFERPRGAQTGVAENTDGWANRDRHSIAIFKTGDTSGVGPEYASNNATPNNSSGNNGNSNPANAYEHFAEVQVDPPELEQEQESAYASGRAGSSPSSFSSADVSGNSPFKLDFSSTPASDGGMLAQRAGAGRQRMNEINAGGGLGELMADNTGPTTTDYTSGPSIGGAGKTSLQQLLKSYSVPGMGGIGGAGKPDLATALANSKQRGA